MEIIKCGEADVPVLARYNKQLIEDEGSDNQMSVQALEDRMRSFLLGDYAAFLFVDGDIIGYALINLSKKPPYLRQFLIRREYRQKHYGKAAFHLLMETIGCDSIDLEVLSGNQVGAAFWSSLGFKEHSRYLCLEK